MTIEVTVDARKRVSLGSLATRDKYLADVELDGTIVLTPAVVMSEMEARLLDRQDILDTIARERAAGMVGERPVRRS